jgi:glycosyltransferase involved in cell wall biosynthesis
MNASKNILIVFPHNFYERKSGVHKRYYELVTYLKKKGFTIDLLALKHFESSWKNFNLDNSDELIHHLFLYDFRIGFQKQRLWSFFSKWKFLFGNQAGLSKGTLPDYSFTGMINLYNKIIKQNKYDYIIIGYVYWANLLKENIPPNIIKVLTIEDFTSQKLFENSPSSVDFEDLVKDEIERVNLFDKVICLSYEELQFFSTNAVNPEYFFVPVFMDQPNPVPTEKDYDILFIGYDNVDNREGLEWFFKKVYPLLNADLKIIIIGKIARYAPGLRNVKKIEYLPEVGEIYSKSKISINPLQKGTGMKVKVIESIAHGIPIINTSKGLCGISPEILSQFIIANDPQGFAGEIDHLLNDANWYQEKCNEAKKTFGTYFDVSVAKNELDKIFSVS